MNEITQRLADALRPFAELAKAHEDFRGRPEIVCESHGCYPDYDSRPIHVAITCGHLFTAAEVLAALDAPSQGEGVEKLQAERDHVIQKAREFGRTLSNWFEDLCNAETFPSERGLFIARRCKKAEDENAQLKAEVERLRGEKADAAWMAPREERERLLDENDTLRARIAELEQGWISVEERLPEFGRCVLVHCPERKNTYAAYWSGQSWHYFGGDHSKIAEEVTHWRPLPPAPEPQEDAR